MRRIKYTIPTSTQHSVVPSPTRQSMPTSCFGHEFAHAPVPKCLTANGSAVLWYGGRTSISRDWRLLKWCMARQIKWTKGSVCGASGLVNTITSKFDARFEEQTQSSSVANWTSSNDEQGRPVASWLCSNAANKRLLNAFSLCQIKRASWFCRKLNDF